MNKIQFIKLDPRAILPTRGSANAAGLDLYSIENKTIELGARVAIRTGLGVIIPNEFYGRVAPRSGLASKNGIHVLGGVIDSDYTGEIYVLLINHGEENFEVMSKSRIAQLIIESIILPTPEWTIERKPTKRGNQGFGSTGY